MSQKVNILALYESADTEFYTPIQKQFQPIVKRISAGINTSADIPAGDARAHLTGLLEEADLVIPIISGDYWNGELFEWLHDSMMEKFKRGDITLMPVIARPNLMWEQEFEDIQVWPKNENDRPLSTLDPAKQEDRHAKIARDIIDNVQQLLTRAKDGSEAELLTKCLYKLNYYPQKQDIHQFYQQLGNRFNPLNIFLINGTAECGHELLIECIRRDHDIKTEMDPERIPLDYLNPRPRALWHEVRQALQLPPQEGSPEKVARMICERLRHESILLRFDNIGACQREEMLKAVNQFWHELNGFMESADPAQLPNQLFIFIIDKHADYRYQADDFRTSGDLHQRLVRLLPTLQPVSSQDLDRWLDFLFDQGEPQRSLSNKLRQGQQQIVPEDGVYIQSAIEKIIDQLQLQSHKTEIMKRLNLL